MKRFIASLAITVMMGLSLNLSVLTNSTNAQATYSCGSYGSGNYSTNDACNGTTTTTAPNTGFAAKLAEPIVAIPLGLSLLALVAGILLLVRRRKKHMSFNQN